MTRAKRGDANHHHRSSSEGSMQAASESEYGAAAEHTCVYAGVYGDLWQKHRSQASAPRMNLSSSNRLSNLLLLPRTAVDLAISSSECGVVTNCMFVLRRSAVCFNRTANVNATRFAKTALCRHPRSMPKFSTCCGQCSRELEGSPVQSLVQGTKREKSLP